MPSFELLSLALIAAAAALAGAMTWAALARGRPSASEKALDDGDYESVLAAVDEEDANGRELLALAVAAKHSLELERADSALDRLLAREPDHGEAWLERGLVAAYAGRHRAATEAFKIAATERSDLTEALQLHQAWSHLDAGNEESARRLFDEIAAPIENKLRRDIGGADPFFAEWYAQSARLWAFSGDLELARWAASQALTAAPDSALVQHLCEPVP